MINNNIHPMQKQRKRQQLSQTSQWHCNIKILLIIPSTYSHPTASIHSRFQKISQTTTAKQKW